MVVSRFITDSSVSKQSKLTFTFTVDTGIGARLGPQVATAILCYAFCRKIFKPVGIVALDALSTLA